MMNYGTIEVTFELRTKKLLISLKTMLEIRETDLKEKVTAANENILVRIICYIQNLCTKIPFFWIVKCNAANLIVFIDIIDKIKGSVHESCF